MPSGQRLLVAFGRERAPVTVGLALFRRTDGNAPRVDEDDPGKRGLGYWVPCGIRWNNESVQAAWEAAVKLDAPQVLEGYFWLPGQLDRVSGRLRISEVAECSLELMGAFGGENAKFRDETRDLSTIHGVVQGGSVTLYDCFYLNENVSFGGVAISKLHVATVFRGATLPAEAQLRFSKLEAAVAGLDDWLQITGIDAGFEFDAAHKLQSAFIRYVPPPKIELSLLGIHVSFEFFWTVPAGKIRNEAKITHQARLVVVPEVDATFDDLRQQLGRLVNFFSFAADQTLEIDALFAYTPLATMDVPGGEKPICMPVFYESSRPDRRGEVERYSMLFSYPDVADRLQDMLADWLAHHEALSPAFNLYFAVRAGRHTFLESRFLSIAQGLETLHDRTSSETLEPPEQFAERVSEILTACPHPHREWLEEQLAYANKLSLRKRMQHLLKPFTRHFGNAKARKGLVDKMVDTRNYLTHYDPALAAHAAQRGDLLPLVSKLEALFQLHLLLLVGIDQSRIDALVASNRKLRWRLGAEPG